MSASSLNDISAICLDDTEEGEIVDDDSVVILSEKKNDDNGDESFFDILKRSFDKRNANSQNGSLSLDESFGGRGEGKDDRKKESRAPNGVEGPSSTAPSKATKRPKDFSEMRERLNASFSAYDEIVAKIANVEEPIGESSFSRDINREKARQNRQSATRVEDRARPENIAPGNDKKKDEERLVYSTPELVSRALNKKENPRRVVAPIRKINREPTSKSPLRSAVTFPLTPPSASTPKKIERVYSQRPAISKPIYVEETRRTSRGVHSIVSQPAKRARSPDETESRTKRTRWNNNVVKRVETVDLTKRRPLLVQTNGRARTVSYNATTFAPPRPQPAPRAHVRARTTADKEQSAEYNRQELLAKMIDEKYDHVIFVDLDNWVNFFGHLTTHLPSKAFVWVFWGAQTNWYPPRGNRFFDELVRTNRFEETMAGRDKDAADFAMVLKIGQMDKDVKKPDIGFTIVTGDRGFQQVRLDFCGGRRTVDVVNPHMLKRRNGSFQDRESMDSALRRRCHRSQSSAPKLRVPAISCRQTALLADWHTDEAGGIRG